MVAVGVGVTLFIENELNESGLRCKSCFFLIDALLSNVLYNELLL
jgi:hypothetical protein